MAELIEDMNPKACGNSCQAATSIEALNHTCYCRSLDYNRLTDFALEQPA